MAGIVFSKNSAKNDGLWKAVDGAIMEIIESSKKEYNKDETVLNALFNKEKSDKAIEGFTSYTDFGLFEEVPEGSAAISDEIEESFNKTFVHYQFMKSFSVTAEMVEDGKLKVASEAAAAMVREYKRTQLEFATLALTSNSATFSYKSKIHDCTAPDGLPLFSKVHKSKKSGVKTQCNIFDNPIGETIRTLNYLANTGRNFKNENGVPMGGTFDTLVIPANRPDLEEMSRQIIGADNEVGTDRNNINTQMGRWKYIVNHRWIAQGNEQPYILLSSEMNRDLKGNLFFDRIPLETDNEKDIKTANRLWVGRGRFSCGFLNWRHVIMGGTPEGVGEHLEIPA